MSTSPASTESNRSTTRWRVRVNRQCARGPVVALPPGSTRPGRPSDRPQRSGSWQAASTRKRPAHQRRLPPTQDQTPLPIASTAPARPPARAGPLGHPIADAKSCSAASSSPVCARRTPCATVRSQSVPTDDGTSPGSVTDAPAVGGIVASGEPDGSTIPIHLSAARHRRSNSAADITRKGARAGS